MTNFKDRVSQNINRKKLIVKDIKRDQSGEISELTVDVNREEGVVTEEGTKLTASSLEAILGNGLDFLFKQQFSLQNNLQASWAQVVGNLKETTFRIDTPQRVYGKLEASSPGGIGVVVSSYSNYINVLVLESSGLNTSTGYGTKDFEFYVGIY